MTPELELLRSALETALIVARSGVTAAVRIEAPRALRPFLNFTKPLPGALAAARAALDDDEFRARVLARCDEEGAGRAGWLFLSRPEGWKQEFSELVEQRRADRAAVDEQVRVGDLERELAHAAEQNDVLTAEVARLVRELDRTRHQADAAERARTDAEQRVTEAIEAAETARNDRARAVRELKDMERVLARRTSELQEIQASSQPGSSDGAGIEGDRDHHELLDRRAMTAALEEIRSGWAALSELIDRGDSRAAQEPSAATRRRVAVRLGGGMVDGTVEAARWLMSRPGAVVLVDGYNVSMLAWPGLAVADQRGALERATGNLQVRSGASVVLVFDGDGPARVTARSDVAPAVSVVFTDVDTEADDDLLAMVDQATQPVVVVVSNDRRVLDGAGTRGANVVRSSEYLALLRSP